MESSGTGECKEPGCLERHHPVKNPGEFLSLLAIVMVCVGMLLTMIGFVIPRESGFDPMMTAREMEKMENYYASLGYRLDICVSVGIGFVATGSLLMSGLLMKGICLGEYNDLLNECSATDAERNAKGNSMGVFKTDYGSSRDTDRTALTQNDQLSADK